MTGGEGGLVVEFWYWLVLAAALAGLEMVAPGAVLIWLGAAAAVVGTVLWLVPELTWQGQVLLFAGLSIAFVFGGRRVFGRGEGAEPHPTLNRRANQYVGTIHALATPLVNGRGRVQVGDTQWTAEGVENLPAGTRVRVVGADGVVLKVERVE